MKKFYGLFFCLIICFCAHAQDRITTLQGDEILAKVLVIDSTHIYYLKIDSNKTSPTQLTDTQIVNIKDVFMITYANSSKDLFATINTPKQEVENNGQKLEDDKFFLQGQQDAKQYFDATGAFFAGFGGLITGALVVSATPQIKPNKVSDPTLITNKSYRLGYEKEAKRKKLNNAAAGFGTASALSILMVVALILTIN